MLKGLEWRLHSWNTAVMLEAPSIVIFVTPSISGALVVHLALFFYAHF